MTDSGEGQGFIHNGIFFDQRLAEVNLMGADMGLLMLFRFVLLFQFLNSVLGVISHGLDLLDGSVVVGDLHLRIFSGSIGVLDIAVSAGVIKFDVERKMETISIFL
jgi:hypothetical protein